jgi:uncharacterized protein (DUF2062 family)
MIILSTSLALAALLCGVLMYNLPDSVGRLLLHDTWEPAHSVVFVFALALAVSAANTGAQVGMRSLGATGNLVKARMIAAPVIAVGVVIGAIFAGAAGAAAGNAVATAIVNVEWWRRFRMSNARFPVPVAPNRKEEQEYQLE